VVAILIFAPEIEAKVTELDSRKRKDAAAAMGARSDFLQLRLLRRRYRSRSASFKEAVCKHSAPAFQAPETLRRRASLRRRIAEKIIRFLGD
jgi:hypothetical protein